MSRQWISLRPTRPDTDASQDWLDECAAKVQQALETQFSEEFTLFQHELGEALTDSIVFGDDFDAKAESIVANFNRRMAQHNP